LVNIPASLSFKNLAQQAYFRQTLLQPLSSKCKKSFKVIGSQAMRQASAVLKRLQMLLSMVSLAGLNRFEGGCVTFPFSASGNFYIDKDV